MPTAVNIDSTELSRTWWWSGYRMAGAAPWSAMQCPARPARRTRPRQHESATTAPANGVEANRLRRLNPHLSPFGSSGDDSCHPLRRSFAPVEAGAKCGEYLRHVPYQVIANFGRVHYEEPTTPRGQRSFHVLTAEPAEAVTVLDHDRAHRPVSKEGQKLAVLPVQRGPYLGHHPAHGQALRGPRGRPRHLPIQIGGLVSEGHARLDGHALRGFPYWRVTQEQVAHTPGGHGSFPSRNQR